jgi:hypothetical protein
LVAVVAHLASWCDVAGCRAAPLVVEQVEKLVVAVELFTSSGFVVTHSSPSRRSTAEDAMQAVAQWLQVAVRVSADFLHRKTAPPQ